MNNSAMDRKDKEGWKPGIAGFIGGAASTMLLLPLDNVKVRLQVNEGMQAKTTSVLSDQRRFGAVRMFRYIIKYEGVGGLYQGLFPAVVGSAVSWGGFFYVYEGMKRQLQLCKTAGEGQPLATLDSRDNFVLGTLSGFVMVFLTNPVWLIKLRMQLQMKKIHTADSSKNEGGQRSKIRQFWHYFPKFAKINGLDELVAVMS